MPTQYNQNLIESTMTNDRLYILYDGRKLDADGCREYIAKESYEHQIANWIDANEPEYELMAFSFKPSQVAMALVEWDTLRSTIADFIFDNGMEDGLVYFNITPLKSNVLSSGNRKPRFRLGRR